MKILGIESSCDETALALVENGVQVIISFKATSLPLHQTTGGIVPEVAARAQLESMIPLLAEISSVTPLHQIDGLAVTYGPGLIGSLLVGLHTARTLSFFLEKPLVPVNHVLAHLYANFITDKSENQGVQEFAESGDQNLSGFTDRPAGRFTDTPIFPSLGLIVSGGHTELVLIRNHGDYEVLGGTRDDAVGEAFDKVARFLGLAEYPGGPVIEKIAREGDSQTIPLPRPMLESDDYDFSFSGLKTAVVNYVTKNQDVNGADLAASFQQAAVEVLVQKTLRGAREFEVKSILLGGGVAANQLLRQSLVKGAGKDFKVLVPPLKYCMDDGAYIASCAYYNYHPVPWQEVKANPNLRL